MIAKNFPSLRELCSSEVEDVFISKLYACCEVYDFGDGSSDLAHKEAKLYNLQDIVEYVSSRKGSFTPKVLSAFMTMVTCNIIRALPVGNSTDAIYDAEEDEPYYEPSWVHLELVYELLRKFIVSSDSETRAARQLITPKFVAGVVDLFNSEDPREREYLKTILHRIYGKVMPLRAPIRRAISHAFYRVVHERARHNGVSELLEILGSIINGFSIPLKEEHKTLLRRALLPLHGASTMPQFHVQLSFCVTQYVHKDPALAVDVLKELLKHWPVTHTRKEIMFLGELEEVLELAQIDDVAEVIGPVFRQIARCTTSMHFQVAERVLYFWNSQHIVTLFEAYRKPLMPILAGALHENLSDHWNPNVQNLSYHVQNLLRDLDLQLYEDSIKLYHGNTLSQRNQRVERDARWAAVRNLAEQQRNLRRSNMSTSRNNSNNNKEVIIRCNSTQYDNNNISSPTDVMNNNIIHEAPYYASQENNNTTTTPSPHNNNTSTYQHMTCNNNNNSKVRINSNSNSGSPSGGRTQQQQKVFIEESRDLLKAHTTTSTTPSGMGVDLTVL